MFTLTYAEALKMAKKLAHSVSKQETRDYLCGFFVHRSEDKHYAVSTDGHMLTRLEINPDYDPKGEFPAVIFPTAAIKQIESFKLSMSERRNATVLFSVDGLLYEIECLGRKAGGKLVDGHYPDYSRVIPSGWQCYTNEYQREGFSPVYLAAVMKAASYNANTFKAEARPVRLFFEGGGPAVVQENDPAVLYIVMPMRSALPEHRHAKPEPATGDSPGLAA
jgi:DNA polymerase III sliding clamp (beta) subunit (PCNA family)